MIYHFPYDAAPLQRTKLAYANLPGILSDGKRDRQARVPGFVAMQLGERCFLVFLRDGEPFYAARLTPQAREPASLAEVLRLASAEIERGEGGHIGFYAASEEQLLAMLSTLVQEPAAPGDPLDAGSPERLFPVLRDRAFTGILELASEEGCRHYLAFRGGAFFRGWFAGAACGTPIPEVIRSIFAGAPLRAALFPALAELPVQAGPGLVDLYRRVLGGTLREVALATGRDPALELLRQARSAAAAECAAVTRFEITADGRVAGDPVAAPEELTAGVARWVTEVLSAAAEHHGVDPAAVVEKVGRDSRFVLQEHGFFARLPWAPVL
jgi:hypothetical protein